MSRVGIWLVLTVDTYEEDHFQERPLHPTQVPPSSPLSFDPSFFHISQEDLMLGELLLNLEHLSGYMWYVGTIMNINTADLDLLTEKDIYDIADIVHIVKTIYIRLNTSAYIYTETCLELSSSKY